MQRARYSSLEGKAIALWGLGRETLPFASALPRLAPTARIDFVVGGGDETAASAESLGLELVSEEDSADRLASVDLIVRSPGVSMYRTELEAARAAGIQVRTSTGLWIEQEHLAPVIAVTGTKGKSTTATMVKAVINAAGRTAELAGNIGRAAIELEAVPAPDFYVLELSSYQIADLPAGPEFAVLTNLSPEHPEWHEGIENYYADKIRLLQFDSLRAVAINAEDSRSAVLTISADRTLFCEPTGFHVKDDAIWHREELLVQQEQFPLIGRHNMVDYCAALAIAEAAGIKVSREVAVTGASALKPLPHRLEPVPTTDGRTWIDDSISTTAESAIAALEAFSGRRIALIAGGHDRDQDYSELCRRVLESDNYLACTGSNGERLWQTAIDIGISENRRSISEELPGAIWLAAAFTDPGDVILLSPGAPSYGEFRSFEERGAVFQKWARAAQPK